MERDDHPNIYQGILHCCEEILSLYLQESTGSPEAFSLSQWIYYSCIKSFPYLNQGLTEPAPLRTLSEIPEGDNGLTAHFLVNKFIYSSILNVRYWDNDSIIAQEDRMQHLWKASFCCLAGTTANKHLLEWGSGAHCQNSIYAFVFLRQRGWVMKTKLPLSAG